jgi:hypothetical protein
MTSTIDSLGGALHAPAPYRPLADELRLFGQFIGAWDLTWRGPDHDGNEVVVRGELHFGWVLDGRAIQDVWRVPVDPADAARIRGFHGTTIRFYDPAIGAWRSTWLDPVNGRVRRFIGRPTDGGIVMEATDDDLLERWSFSRITPGSFLWTGEESTDGGRTWAFTDEMTGRRR